MAGQDDTSVGQQDYVLPSICSLKQASNRKPQHADTRAYIQAIFDIGQETNEKANATKVAQDMRTATDDKGTCCFRKSICCSQAKLKACLDPWLKQPRSQDRKKLVSDTSFCQDDSDEEENQEESDENEMLSHIMDNITGLAHPVVYQDINLCEKKTLKKYGEKNLQSMLHELELNPDGTSKAELVQCTYEQ